MGPLLHTREDGWADCPIQRQHKTHIMYIIFSVCLHRHSIGVLVGWGGGGGHVNTTLTSHLQVICSRFIWASGSVKFSSFYYLIFLGQWGSLCQPLPCLNPAAGNIFSLEFSRYSWCQGIASVISFYLRLLVAICILHFGCSSWFSLPGCVELNVGQCVC